MWSIIEELAGTVWTGITAAWNWGAELITGTTQTAGENVQGIFSGIVSVGKWFADGISAAFYTVEYVGKHWAETMELVGSEALLGIVTFANNVEYTFGTALPYAIEYLGRNWKEILTDLVTWTGTVFENLGTNIVSVFKNLGGLIKGNVNFSDVWKPLTEGFQSSIKESFNLPQQVKGEYQAQLETDVAGLEKAYGEGIGDFLAKKQSDAQQGAAAITAAVTNGLKPLAKPIQPPKIAPVIVDAKLRQDKIGLTISPKIEPAEFVRVGSAESALDSYELYQQAQATKFKPPAPPPPPVPVSPAAPGAIGAAWSAAKGAIDKTFQNSVVDANGKKLDYLYKLWQASVNTPLTVATF